MVTPDQAKIYVAMLEAEGIPAFVDGNSSADEFAMSKLAAAYVALYDELVPIGRR